MTSNDSHPVSPPFPGETGSLNGHGHTAPTTFERCARRATGVRRRTRGRRSRVDPARGNRLDHIRHDHGVRRHARLGMGRERARGRDPRRRRRLDVVRGAGDRRLRRGRRRARCRAVQGRAGEPPRRAGQDPRSPATDAPTTDATAADRQRVGAGGHRRAGRSARPWRRRSGGRGRRLPMGCQHGVGDDARCRRARSEATRSHQVARPTTRRHPHRSPSVVRQRGRRWSLSAASRPWNAAGAYCSADTS